MQRKALKSIFIFICAYLVFLVLWINVKDYYGYALTYAVSSLVVPIKGVALESVTKKDDIIEIEVSRQSYREKIIGYLPLKTSFYTFNVPLTCAILAAFHPFIKRRTRGYTEALVILLFVHALYISSLELKGLTEMSMSRGIEPMSKIKLGLYQFFWSFTDNMIIRFEPFLIGIYVFFRFRAQGSGFKVRK
jgi:hypothetical protein